MSNVQWGALQLNRLNLHGYGILGMSVYQILFGCKQFYSLHLFAYCKLHDDLLWSYSVDARQLQGKG